MDDMTNYYDRPDRAVISEHPEVAITRTPSMIDPAYAAAYGLTHRKAVHWGPVMAGVVTSLVTTLLFGALFTGLGFSRDLGAFGGLTAQSVGWGAIIAMAIGVFAGGYLTGFASDLRSRSESLLNGFTVGCMAILTPILLAVVGSFSAAGLAAQTTPNPQATVQNPDVQNQIATSLQIAADNAWAVFLGGLLILAVATGASYLGAKSRKGAFANRAKPGQRDVNYAPRV